MVRRQCPSNSVVFCHTFDASLIGRCGGELPLNSRSGSSLPFSLVTGTTRTCHITACRLDAADTREVREMIELTAAYHSPARGRVLTRKARSWYANVALFDARDPLMKVGFAPAWRQIVEALRLCHSPRVIWKICSFFGLWFRIVASRVKRRVALTSRRLVGIK